MERAQAIYNLTVCGGRTVKALNSAGICRLLVSAVLIGGICLSGQEPRVGSPDTKSSSSMRSVEGIVSNPKGEPVADAVVLLKDSKTLQVRSFITLKDGSYHFYGLTPDVSYDVRADLGKESSGTKTVSSFNDKKKITLNLKLKS
jgi:hypothetical protein